MKPKNSLKKIILIIISITLVGLLSYGIYYLTSYLPADAIAKESLISTQTVHVQDTKDLIIFTPTDKKPTVALIYYPGAKVEPSSFAYAASKIAKEGTLVIIQKMPFNLAILGIDKAASIILDYPEINSWFISGFSLGGTSASMYAYKNQTILDGLILYASYTTKDANLANASFPVLSISGTNDGLATPLDIQKASQYLPIHTDFVEIQGGNHTQMALYNNHKLQHGDTPATISNMEQQEIIIQETIKFIHNNENK